MPLFSRKKSFNGEVSQEDDGQVSAIVERVRESSPLLQKQSQTATAQFQGDEIVLGNSLFQFSGEFSTVFVVQQLPSAPSTSPVSGSDGGTIACSSEEEDERRRVCTSEAEFVVKIRNPKLNKKKNKKDKQIMDLAAATLILEVGYHL